VVRTSKWKQHGAGDELIREGSADDHFYILASGLLKVTQRGKLLNAVSPGECVGEMAYARRDNNKVRSATVAAVEPSWAMRMRVDEVDKLSEGCRARLQRSLPCHHGGAPDDAGWPPGGDVTRTLAAVLLLFAGNALAAYDGRRRASRRERERRQEALPQRPLQAARIRKRGGRAPLRRRQAVFAGMETRITFYLKKDAVVAFDVRFDVKFTEKMASTLRGRYGKPSTEQRAASPLSEPPRAAASSPSCYVSWRGGAVGSLGDIALLGTRLAIAAAQRARHLFVNLTSKRTSKATTASFFR